MIIFEELYKFSNVSIFYGSLINISKTTENKNII